MRCIFKNEKILLRALGNSVSATLRKSCLMLLLILICAFLTACTFIENREQNYNLRRILDHRNILPKHLAEYNGIDDPQKSAEILDIPFEDLLDSDYIFLETGESWVLLFKSQEKLLNYYGQLYERVRDNEASEDKIIEFTELDDLGEAGFMETSIDTYKNQLRPPSYEIGSNFRQIYFYRCKTLVVVWLSDPLT